MKDDKYMNPNNKARWGFGGTAQKITVGPQTVGEAGGVEHVRTEPANEGAHNNGGGDAQPAANGNGADPRDSLTIPQIKEQLDAKGVTYASTLNKAELLELLNAQPSTQE